MSGDAGGSVTRARLCFKKVVVAYLEEIGMEKLEDFDMGKANSRIEKLEKEVKELAELLNNQQLDSARIKQRLSRLEAVK